MYPFFGQSQLFFVFLRTTQTTTTPPLNMIRGYQTSRRQWPRMAGKNRTNHMNHINRMNRNGADIVDDELSAATPCFFFLRGKCTFGEECRFSHDPVLCSTNHAFLEEEHEGKEESNGTDNMNVLRSRVVTRCTFCGICRFRNALQLRHHLGGIEHRKNVLHRTNVLHRIMRKQCRRILRYTFGHVRTYCAYLRRQELIKLKNQVASANADIQFRKSVANLRAVPCWSCGATLPDTSGFAWMQ